MTAKTHRLELRLTERQKSEIEHAAALSGRSVTDFSVSALVREAEETIVRERDLQISERGWNLFSAVLDQPAKSVPKLADLLKRPSVFVE